MYIYICVYIYIYREREIDIDIDIDIDIYLLTLSAFCIECQIFCNDLTRHFFKSVIFPISRIFNVLKSIY